MTTTEEIKRWAASRAVVPSTEFALKREAGTLGRSRHVGGATAALLEVMKRKREFTAEDVCEKMHPKLQDVRLASGAIQRFLRQGRVKTVRRGEKHNDFNLYSKA